MTPVWSCSELVGTWDRREERWEGFALGASESFVVDLGVTDLSILGVKLSAHPGHCKPAYPD